MTQIGTWGWELGRGGRGGGGGVRQWYWWTGWGGGGAERGQDDGEDNVNVGFQSFSIPAMYSMWGAWAPTAERATLVSLSFSGQNVANSVAFPTAALLCKYGFAGGWPSVFYVSGTSRVRSGTSVRSTRSGACRCWRCSLVTSPVTSTPGRTSTCHLRPSLSVLVMLGF